MARLPLGTMESMESILSIIATIISSIALIAVAASLTLQNRQLKASQIQVAREMHLELMKRALENPTLAAPYVVGNSPKVRETIFINLQVTIWKVFYSLGQTTREGVASNAADLFAAETAREWWTSARKSYEVNAMTKRDREFFAVVDGEFHTASRALQSDNRPNAALPGEE